MPWLFVKVISIDQEVSSYSLHPAKSMPPIFRKWYKHRTRQIKHFAVVDRPSPVVRRFKLVQVVRCQAPVLPRLK